MITTLQPPEAVDVAGAWNRTPRLLARASLPWRDAPALRERVRDWLGGHPVDPDHQPHLEAALGWLERAQDVHPGGGVARGYSLAYHAYFGSRGWQPDYPETTGYIIPTLYHAAAVLRRPQLAERAERAARWELEWQLESGAVRGGTIADVASPAVFNTGQVIFGWLAAFAERGHAVFADAAGRAGDFLLRAADADGLWRRMTTRFADPRATLYNTRTAWALAEAGRRLDRPDFSTLAHRSLLRAGELQQASGWLPDCCLNDPSRPLLHTLAYAIRGFIEGARLFDDERLLRHGTIAAAAIRGVTQDNGFIPGRLAPSWRPVARWSCLTGTAQMANIWLRLHALTGDADWRSAVPRALHFLKASQNRSSDDPGLRGGIKGSYPCSGEYGRYEVLSWGTKFFVDALLRSAPGADAAHAPDSATLA